MKFYAMTFALLSMLSLSNASAWETVDSCDNGTFTYDIQFNTQGTGYEGQMVLRGNLVRWLLKDIKVIVPSQINQKGELIARIAPGEYGQPGSIAILINGLYLNFLSRENKLKVTYYNG